MDEKGQPAAKSKEEIGQVCAEHAPLVLVAEVEGILVGIDLAGDAGVVVAEVRYERDQQKASEQDGEYTEDDLTVGRKARLPLLSHGRCMYASFGPHPR